MTFTNTKNAQILLQKLLIAHGMDPNLTNDLPVVGRVVVQDDIVIAAGFMRDMEGPYAMLDSYITNPEASPIQRHKALNLITDSLIKVSKSLGKNKLIMFSQDRNTHQRALMHGFTNFPDMFTAILDLTKTIIHTTKATRAP